MTVKSLGRLVIASALLFCANPVFSSSLFADREEVRDYLRTVSAEHGLDETRLNNLFAGLKSQQPILDAISRPAERRLSWGEYRPIFIKKKRIDLGRQFLIDNRADLERAASTYGVPVNVITAIIGVETFYGRITGKHDVLESLATLAFDYPPRASFFRTELTEFLVISESEGWATDSVKGSYAGAMGLPQFISSSYREYAVDFDGDGKRDLFNSKADAIGSVANYLARHGWVEGAPVAASWPQSGSIPSRIRSLVSKSLKPAVSADDVKNLGFESSTLAPGTANGRSLSVMVLNSSGAEEVWVGYRNFYAITRYNHSRLYAMAVFQLANALNESSS